MATSNTTRYEQISAILAYAAEQGYQGDTDKLEKVKEQWASKGGNSAAYQENLGYAETIKNWMVEGETYTNEQIREGVTGLPVGSKGKVEPSKVNAIMNAGKSADMFKVQVLGKMRFYSLA